jgi:DNA-binding response OmpR family regulator/two-component sensor histidine kinase
MKINLMEDDIVKYLRILVYEFLSAAESKQIKYIADLPENEFFTWFDRDKIEKIISNLLSNAFKYTPVNGMIQCSVQIQPPENQNYRHLLTISVVDSGPGISGENLDKIFDRFFRVEGRSEAESHGTGIGLSLTQEFVKLLHGRIEVRSEPGKGSEFMVRLPLGKDHLQSDEYIVVSPSGSEKNRSVKAGPVSVALFQGNERIHESRIKVLVIEDNEDLRNFIRENLADKYQVLGAENGRVGLNMAFTMMPDIIITDIMMPDINGIQLCTTLKNDERTSHIPVIMVTAKATTDDKLEGLKSGADDYIVKPFIMDELKARIANLLAMREKLKLKYLNVRITENISEKPESVDDRFMQKVVRVINENITNFEFDVGILHERMGMSRMHLSRKLKILTGESPHIFIRNIRLRRASELLLNNAGNITEIAYSVGFSNASAFTKAFRDYFGVPPKKYSKQ